MKTITKSVTTKKANQLNIYSGYSYINGLNREILCMKLLYKAYIKYGCLSIREIVTKIRIKYSIHHELIRQLIWRDFYMHLLSENPESLEGLANSRMRKIRWSSNKDRLKKWKNGKTGFPIVDAGMRQMNETGYMHNRVRMIVATFLSKILYLDWRDGEKYFAQKLVDYDVASNTGNWQAVVGGGLYAMPWFHILSPWTQSKKNDSDLEYIREWVPELEDVPDKHIHKWYKYYKQNMDIDYPKPIIDFDKRRDEYMIKMKDILS
jgi:deoxyribodipyrimidine photo-lyase